MKAVRTHCQTCRAAFSVAEMNQNYVHCQVCIEKHAASREERHAMVLEMTAAGRPNRDIVSATGFCPSMVRWIVKRDREDADNGNGNGARCPRCSLLLPHATCLAPSWAVAQQRREAP